MIDSKIMAITKSILKDFGNTYFSDNGALKRNKVIEDLDAYTPMLMKALLANKLIHDTYTESILVNGQNVEIFKLNQFIEMFTYKEYWQDSYTKFENKIGLTAGNKFIDETADVVLDFPFKDAILKAGMTKEDQKNANEPFLNETIAKAEIDQLLEPKIFVNATRYDTNSTEGIATDEFNTNNDNLIIKGNNLIALHSLRQNYTGRIKFIYIDPPYNTGKDSFAYNDHFTRSAWLTFMKNRLEVAHELLSTDGAIYISIDDNQFAYLKILLDLIFGENNLLETFNIQVRYANKSLNERDDFQRVMEYGLFYAKEKKQFTPNKPKEKYSIDKFIWTIDELNTGEAITLGGKEVRIFKPGEYKISKLSSPSITGLKATWASGSVLTGNTSGKFFDIHLSKRKVIDGLGVLYKVSGIGEDGLGYRYFTGPKKETSTRGQFYSGVPTARIAQLKNGKANKEKAIVNYYDFSADFGNIRQEGGVPFNGGKKPEKLLKLLIEMTTNENDIVLDYHQGSGTTAATAMKLNRNFIGIEQLSSQLDMEIERLTNVIAGDKSGISKDVNWQGGGSFVYAELMEKNQSYLKDVQHAETANQLEDVVNRMIDDGADFDFRIDMTKVLQDSEYQAMSLDEQKKLIIKTIDKNQLYYAYSDLEDSDVQALMEDSDIVFNKSFYEEREL